MNTVLRVLLLASLWSAGSAGENYVTQMPEILWKQQGNSAEMNCSHTKDISYSQMDWYRQRQGETMRLVVFTNTAGTKDFGKDVNSSKYTPVKTVTESGSLTVHDVQADDSGLYFCSVSTLQVEANPAYFGQGTKLTVLENGLEITRPIVKVFPPSKEEICDRDIHKKRKSLSVTLVCVAKDFYPDHVSVIWKINGDDQSQKGAVGKVGTDNSATRDKNGKYYSITSRLRIPLKTWGNAKNTFTCRVDFYNGTHNDPEEASINGQLVPGMPDPDKPLKSAQTAKFAYGIFIAKSCVFGLFIFIFVKKMSRGAKDGKW